MISHNYTVMQHNHEIVWNNCLRIIRDNVGEQSFQTWFAPIRPLRLLDKTLTIQVPSQFFYEWLEEHYVYLLRKAIDAEIGMDGQLEYSVIVDHGKQNKPVAVNLSVSHSANNTTSGRDFSRRNSHQPGNTNKPSQYEGPFSFPAVNYPQIDSQLNTKYSFDTYIEGDCNRLARSAGYAVASSPGTTSFNPLMIYGGVGLGKTHLVQAIGNEIRKKATDKFILYVSSEKFTSQFIEALKNNDVQKFTNLYLQVDVLIIDDVQFLAGKEKTQEIFFHIFNHLHQSGKQIIMTSDCPPRDLYGLTERLVSRFKWGLTADIQTPDFETRIAIIHRKMQNDDMDIPNDVIEYVAYNVDTNVREIEGILVSLIAHASLNRRDIDLELAKQVLKHIVIDSDTEIGMDMIMKSSAKYFGITLEELKSKSRKKEVVNARQMAMYLAKEHTQHSLKAIGYHFGGRDHATVIHAIRTVQNSMKDQKVNNDIKEIRAQFRGKKPL